MTRRRGGGMRAVEAFTLSLAVAFNFFEPAKAELKNCTCSAVYSFGDSLTDNGNGIATFPDQFIDSETNPNGFNFPHHAADRYCDGRLLVDYVAFGMGRKPNYAILRSIAADFTYGANFAVAGATARNNTEWVQETGFSSPFSLNVQVSWLERYKVRLQFYYAQVELNSTTRGVVYQSLPASDSLNTSLYFVYAGFQDYFFPMYYQTMTPTEALDIVDAVVDSIVAAIQRIYAFGARSIMIVNLPPMGCLPALLTLYADEDSEKYDTYGCLDSPNKVSNSHNTLLESRVADLRHNYTNATFYYADYYSVYRDVLKSPTLYGISESDTLTACCGYGGSYNFNASLFCTHSGIMNGGMVNLSYPCSNSTSYINWDGIHPTAQMNWITATLFLNGTHITPAGGFNCSADTSNWYN
ncbi:GDSL esterase/lipase At4g01130 isoform X2 [Physcomitrium patens]|uniref:GDSL esterase/lipase n=1 Tax=Physcomitrium patens TaxID=3218 RepID=A0A2K1IR27_PHYPA|nr:GDSL esterase/lipase At4g01130-like [Physcomitrium patens]PNR31717.1 hypothetical protein PHYPA_025840 [Physcomitrium patens]|eukprot:XP_024359742.1 GDSL esterase/lipase At4g01130-like [Physcomitrella patens]